MSRPQLVSCGGSRRLGDRNGRVGHAIEVLDDDACREIVSTLVVALKTITLALGGVISHIAYNSDRRTHARPIGALALDFSVVTLGAHLAGAAHQAFGLEGDLVVIIENSLTAVGFGIIVYSLYAGW